MRAIRTWHLGDQTDHYLDNAETQEHCCKLRRIGGMHFEREQAGRAKLEAIRGRRKEEVGTQERT